MGGRSVSRGNGVSPVFGVTVNPSCYIYHGSSPTGAIHSGRVGLHIGLDDRSRLR